MDTPDPVTWLLDCHGRIRKMVRGVAALAQAAPDDPRAVQTALDCERYLRLALPLHACDEDDSLRPMLLGGVADASLAQALHRMSSEHERIDQGLPQALRTLQAAAAGQDVSAPLADLAGWLDGLLLPHIAHEEEHIIPAAALLSPAARSDLARQMRARRDPSAADSSAADPSAADPSAADPSAADPSAAAPSAHGEPR